VHVLPFFRPYDGADAGFDPQDHLEVDPRLGSWDDVRRLAARHDVVVDVIVNHVSSESPPFRDWLEHGERSSREGMFLTLGSVFPAGATEEDLLRVYRPRPGLPLTPFTLAGHERRLLWTTFTSQQVDLDVGHPEARRYLSEVLGRLAASGVRCERLDAVGYAVKTPGTSCFMTPETLAFVGELAGEARGLGLEVLAEVHSHYSRQVEVARHADWVYDFALPPLVLHGLLTGDAAPLRRWLDIRPPNAVTVLDTHDGIGVVDVGADRDEPELAGLLGPDEVDALVERIHSNTRGESRLATGSAASNVDLYQVNSTYYDALGRDPRRYALARAVQFFSPGVPQVYYVGLLAGRNDMELLRRTGVGRDVNRHHYTEDEALEALELPEVRGLRRLIALRNSHPAFGGEMTCPEAGEGRVLMCWRAGEEEARLEADLGEADYVLAFTEGGRSRRVDDVAELPEAPG
jgi:sucrose phosphorylase